MTTVLELIDISKSFSGIKANDHINLSLKKGDIHVLIGENGAGKSTLMNIISGLYQPDSGKILLFGKPSNIKHPVHAIKKGIGMVHQHFMLIPGFTVLENIILGEEKTILGVLNLKASRKRIQEMAGKISFDIPLNRIANRLPVGLQQRVEIFKAIFRNASILIFDEPTAVLTPDESRELFKVMRLLKNRGVSIFFITHKLKEAMEIADVITVIRKGKVISSLPPHQTDEKKLAGMMVGRYIDKANVRNRPVSEKVVLEVNRLEVMDHTGGKAVNGVSFNIRSGEIFGIAGIQGNGQTELAEAISGLCPIHAGEFRLSGKKIPPLNPRKLIEEGVSHIPEDRLKHGLVLSFPVCYNQILSTYDTPYFSAKGILNKRRIMENSKRLIKKFNIKTKGPSEEVRNLSGGNQQKVIISRELNRDIILLIANQPTRGLDIGAVSDVYSRMQNVREKGAAILFISSELDEVMHLSDRIGVMVKGKLIDIFEKGRVSKDMIGMLMASGK